MNPGTGMTCCEFESDDSKIKSIVESVNSIISDTPELMNSVEKIEVSIIPVIAYRLDFTIYPKR